LLPSEAKLRDIMTSVPPLSWRSKTAELCQLSIQSHCGHVAHGRVGTYV